jgi:Rrf2 family protein
MRYLCGMFSKTCEYAIRALIFIAGKSSAGVKVGIKEIASGIDAPEAFIAKILNTLSRKKLVQSFKGPTGGFYLNASSLECSLADVVKAIDGEKIFIGCGLGLPNCSESRPCPIHHEFKILRNDISQLLQGAKLCDLQHQLDKQLAYLKQG